jgi:hypothetical protein
MTNPHIRNLRMLADLNGVRSDDRRILRRAANALDAVLTTLVLITILEPKGSRAAIYAQEAIDEAKK